MKRTKLVCFLMSISMVVTPCMSAMATKDVSVQESNEVAFKERVVGGYVPLAEEYKPEVVTTDSDFEEKEKGEEVLERAGESSFYYPLGEEYMPVGFAHQGSFNTCWAVSAITACEINAKKKRLDVKKMSASHLAYYFFNLGEGVRDPLGNQSGDYARIADGSTDWTMCGGNGRLSMWQLANWIGVAGYTDESSPYNYNNLNRELVLDNTTSSVYMDDTVHVQNVYLTGTYERYRDDVKRLIRELGAVTTGYYSDPEYDSFYKGHVYDDGYALSLGSYYYNGFGNDGYAYKSPNHAVVIVGWDDNYSKSNFVNEPSNDGAWLVLNSWGDENETYAQDGYFWLSYEDVGLLIENCVIGYDVESSENYDNVYQYDGSFGVNTVDGSEFIQFFTMEQDEQIRAASIGIADTDVEYTAKVYAFDKPISAEDVEKVNSWFYGVVDGISNVVGDKEVTCTKICETSGTFSYDGYHTVDFPGVTEVSKGTTVAVVFNFNSPTKAYVDTSYVESGKWKFVTGKDAYRGVVGGGSCNVLDSGTALRLKLFTGSGSKESDGVSFSLEQEELSIDLKDKTKSLSYVLEGVDDPSDYYVRYEVNSTEYLSVGSVSGTITPAKVGGPVYINAFLYDFATDALIASDSCKVTITSALEAVVMGICPSTLSLGESYKIPYRLIPETATLGDKKIEWISDNPSAVTVDENGKVTAVGYGEATIKCSVQGLAVFGSGHRITVSPSFTGVELNKETANIKKGDSTLLEAMILPIDSKDIVDFQWSSSNENVAKVDENGKVTGVGYGEATITVTCGEFKDTCVVTVGGQLTGVELNKDTVAILKDRSVQLVAQAMPVDTTDAVSFTWSSANERIAKVDENGKVTGVGYGTTTVRVTCGSYSDTCKVIVAGQLAAIVLDKESVLLAKGKSSTLVATLEPEELAEEQVITWSSSNGNVATVDKNGKVTAVSEGKCIISVTCGEFKDACEVIVDNIKIYKDTSLVSSVSIAKDAEVILNARWGLQDDIPSVTWKSSNTNIAKVDENGKVTGVSNGTVTVYATVGNGTFVGAVSVKVGGDTSSDVEEDKEVKVALTNKKTEMEVGQSQTLRVSYIPVNLNSVNLIYKSSDSAVAAVSSAGTVTAKKAGTTTITVVLESEKGRAEYSYLLTVKEKSADKPGGGTITGGGDEDITSDYKVVISNIDTVKKLSVNGKTKLDVSVEDVLGNTVSDAQIAYSADEEYLTIDENDNLVGLKAGTGSVMVVAVVDGQTVSRSFYVSVVLGENGYKDTADKEDSKVEEDKKPSNSDKNDKDKLDEIKPDKDEDEKSDENIKDTTPKKAGVEKIVLKAVTRQISSKGKLQIKATVKPESAENKEVKWYTSNKRYATVTQSGLVKAKKAGAGHSVIISCKATDDSGVVASYFVKITEDCVSKIKLSTTQKVKKKVKTESGKKVTKKVKKTFTKKVSVKAGKSFKLKADVKTTGDDVNKKLVWSSSNEDWATVTSKGKVKTKKAGKGHTVTITVRTIDESKKATFKVKIK